MRIGTLLHPSWLARALIGPSKEAILGDLILRCAEAGAEHIELTGEMFTLAPKNILTHLAKEISHTLPRYKDTRGLSYSIHLPYMGGLDISSSIESIRHAALGVFREIVDLTRPLEPLTYVVHIAGMIQEATGGGLIGEAATALKNLLMDNALSSLAEMATYIDPEKICIENLPGTPPELLEKIVQRTDHSLCLDIGHLMVRGDSLEDFLQRYAERTREIHLHDVKYSYFAPYVHVNIDHQALGQGHLPMKDILEKVSRHGFSGPLVLETLSDSEVTSIRALKDMLLQSGTQEKCAQ